MGEVCIKKRIGWADTFQDDQIECLLHCLCRVILIVYSAKKLFGWRNRIDLGCADKLMERSDCV